MSNSTSELVKFGIIITFAIISLPCCLFIIYHYIKYRSFRERFCNKTLVVIVVLVLFNILCSAPMTYSYFFRGESLIHSDAYCHIWQTIDYVFTAAIIWCTAFLTIERYILIFHSSFLRTKQQKNLLHFLPLIMIIAYISVFYILTNSLVRCDAEFNYNSLLCGQNCIDKIDGLSQFNWLFNIILPVFVIIFGSLFLLVRVLWTRREMQQNLRNWSKNSRMIIQLLSVSIVYTIVWMPLSVLSLISTFRKKSVSQDAENVFYFCVYLCEMLVPVIGLISWPELTRRIRSRFRTNSVTSLSFGVYSTN